jgi:ribosomal protein S18 acetylase RimI-like enzyme
MNPNIRIRRATKKDAAVLAGFNRAMAFETEGRKLSPAVLSKGVRSLLQNHNDGFYLVAEIGRKIVGSLMITYEWSDWRNGAFWWLQSVYVLPAFRRKGVYLALHETVKSMAKNGRPKVCGIRLYVDGRNASAQATYKKMGMKVTGYLIFEEEFERPLMKRAAR